MVTCSGVQVTTDFCINHAGWTRRPPSPGGVTWITVGRRYDRVPWPRRSPRRERRPHADSVRLALPAESWGIASVQRRSLGRRSRTRRPPPSLSWRASTSTPWPRPGTAPSAGPRRPAGGSWWRSPSGQVVGLATTLPSQDPDADPAADGAIDELVVDPTARRRGHGSRLVNACVDTLRADGFVRARHWLRADDDLLPGLFLTEAGWAPDGAHREIGADDDADPGEAGPTAHRHRLITRTVRRRRISDPGAGCPAPYPRAPRRRPAERSGSVTSMSYGRFWIGIGCSTMRDTASTTACGTSTVGHVDLRVSDGDRLRVDVELRPTRDVAVDGEPADRHREVDPHPVVGHRSSAWCPASALTPVQSTSARWPRPDPPRRSDSGRWP